MIAQNFLACPGNGIRGAILNRVIPQAHKPHPAHAAVRFWDFGSRKRTEVRKAYKRSSFVLHTFVTKNAMEPKSL
jgi:hypothetical protein